MVQTEVKCCVCNNIHPQLNIFKFKSFDVCNKCYVSLDNAKLCDDCSYRQNSFKECDSCNFINFKNKYFELMKTVSKNCFKENGYCISLNDF